MTEPAEALRDAQRWIRDSTNEEKMAYLSSLVAGAGPEFNLADLDSLRGHSEECRFAHPYHWAAFTYLGA
jgi:CHAT domain-containing protein